MNLLTLPWWLKGILLGALLAGAYALEQLSPALGLWLFVAVTLTLGMGHGALDAVLLLGQFQPSSRALGYGLLYLLLTLLSGWLLSLSFSWALIALLLMSVWHFGTIYSERVWLRLAVGGASVMSPALLQGPALRQLLQGVTTQDLDWLLGVWTALAWAWAALAGWVMASSLINAPSVFSGDNSQPSTRWALLEIGTVLCFGLLLSPLMQFALYFGFYHCTTHIARVQRAVVRHMGASSKQLAWAWGASMLLTGLLMAILWQWLPSAGAWAQQIDAQLLQWLVIALGAVTVPHLLLVGYSDRWLN